MIEIWLLVAALLVVSLISALAYRKAIPLRNLASGVLAVLEQTDDDEQAAKQMADICAKIRERHRLDGSAIDMMSDLVSSVSMNSPVIRRMKIDAKLKSHHDRIQLVVDILQKRQIFEAIERPGVRDRLTTVNQLVARCDDASRPAIVSELTGLGNEIALMEEVMRRQSRNNRISLWASALGGLGAVICIFLELR